VATAATKADLSTLHTTVVDGVDATKGALATLDRELRAAIAAVTASTEEKVRAVDDAVVAARKLTSTVAEETKGQVASIVHAAFFLLSIISCLCYQTLTPHSFVSYLTLPYLSRSRLRLPRR
jgi:hypothetical protein